MPAPRRHRILSANSGDVHVEWALPRFKMEGSIVESSFSSIELGREPDAKKPGVSKGVLVISGPLLSARCYSEHRAGLQAVGDAIGGESCQMWQPPVRRFRRYKHRMVVGTAGTGAALLGDENDQAATKGKRARPSAVAPTNVIAEGLEESKAE